MKIIFVTGCCGRPNYCHRYLKRVSAANTLGNTMTYFYYTGCNRRNGPDCGRVFLRSYYTDITQNTYIQSSMVTEILARVV